MTNQRRTALRRAVLILLHLAIPAALVVWLATAGESLLSDGTPVWKNLHDDGWQKQEEGFESRSVSFDWQAVAGGAPGRTVRMLAIRFDTKRFSLESASQKVADGKKLSELAKGTGCPAACNGGYFGMKGEPVTLLISGGRELAAATEKLPWSGVYWLTPDGAAATGTLDAYRRADAKPDFALQNSPLLVTGGRLCWPPPRRLREPQKDGDPGLYRRTAAGVDGNGLTVLTVCDTPVTLEEWATILLANDQIGGMALSDAINLDGGPSSGLAVCHEKRSSAIEAGRPLPYYLLVRRRPEPLPAAKPAAGEPGAEKPEGWFIRPE